MKYLILLALVVSAGCASKKTQAPAAAPTAAADSETTAAPDAIKAKPSSTAAAASGKLTCTLKEDVRTLEVVNKEQGCEFQYTKSGNMHVDATSQMGTQHCEHVKAKVRTKLEGAGYQCL